MRLWHVHLLLRPPAAPRQPAPHDGRRRHVKLCDYGFAARCTAVSAARAEAREKRGRLRTLLPGAANATNED